jgi:hypothetical protein
MGDMYDRPFDWHKQNDAYDRKMKMYEEEKIKYDTFCTKYLEKIPKTKMPTSSQKEDNENLEICKEKEEKFL